jgi:pyruvate formate lyase activating enzyme
VTEIVSGSVHSFDLSIGVDGPGTRFVTFLAGCPLRCLYCHSPDTWTEHNGRRTTVDDMMVEVDKYRQFISVAGGGFTVSGGEPLLQPAFTTALLGAAKDRGLHTALDTSGNLGARADDDLLANTDLVLLDIKSWHPATYRTVTGGAEVRPTLDFARRLSDRGIAMWIRFVLVPDLTDEPSNVAGIAEFVADLNGVDRVEVLPFHRLGQHKYAALGLPFPLADTEPPSAALVARVREQFTACGLSVC